MIQVVLRFLRFLPFLCVLIACSTNVAHAPTELIPVAADQQVIKKLKNDVEVMLDTAYVRVLKADSQWMRIGRVSQGDVYKPYKNVFTVEGAHIHEAYLVIAQNKLVGFYLPYERGFSSLTKNVVLTFE